MELLVEELVELIREGVELVEMVVHVVVLVELLRCCSIVCMRGCL